MEKYGIQPRWVQHAFFYHLYPLGACGHFSEVPKMQMNELTKFIPKWKSLGINALYIGPVFSSENHGYDTIDYYTVDDRLGNTSQLKLFVQELKKNNIRVVFEAVFNHVGRAFPYFKDIQAKKEKSTYVNWFSGINFNEDSPYNDGFSYESWEGHFNLVKLNLDNPEVTTYLFDVIHYWVKEFNIDGLRLDAADQLSFAFLKQLRKFTDSLDKPLWLLGELLHGDYNQWVNGSMMHACTNYEMYKGLYSSHNDENLYELAHSLNRQFGPGGIYEGKLLYNFTDNHDVERIASILKDEPDLYPLHILLMTIPGIPSIYYESEYGVYGEKGIRNDADLRPKIGEKKRNHPDLSQVISKLSKIRLNPALKRGDYHICFLGHEQLAFYRQHGNHEALIIVNLSSTATTIDITNQGPYDSKKNEIHSQLMGTWIDELNDNEPTHFSHQNTWVHLYPKWGRVFTRSYKS
jgi:glycosidase